MLLWHTATRTRFAVVCAAMSEVAVLTLVVMVIVSSPFLGSRPGYRPGLSSMVAAQAFSFEQAPSYYDHPPTTTSLAEPGRSHGVGAQNLVEYRCGSIQVILTGMTL